MTNTDEGFSFVDKRGGHGDSPEAPETAVPNAPAEAAVEAPDDRIDEALDAHEEPDGEAPEQNLPHLSVSDRLLMCLDIMHQSAWINLGMVADPSTHQVALSLPDARKAIDTVAFLAEQLVGSVDEPTLREVKRLVSDLRVNFVRIQKEAG